MSPTNDLQTEQTDGQSRRLLVHVPDSWQRLVAVIRHQSQAGHFIYIEGAHGAGKSTFSKVLEKKLLLDEEVNVFAIKLHPLISSDQVISLIPVNPNTTQVVILDDAHEVDAKVLEELIASNVNYYWVILAEPELINRVPRLENSRFTLPLFNKEDCHKLLLKQQRFMNTNLDIPLLESELIYFESRGFPGKVIKLGQELPQKLSKRTSSLTSFDLANKGILSSAVIVAGVLVFLGYLLFSGEESETETPENYREVSQNITQEENQTSAQDNEQVTGDLAIELSNDKAEANTTVVADTAVEEGELALELEPKPVTAFDFKAWILSQNPDHYTIQLFSNESLQIAQEFKDNLDLADSYVYQAKVNNKDYYRVIWGIYPNRARAQLAIQSLPKSIIQQKPWLRSFNSIGKELQ